MTGPIIQTIVPATHDLFENSMCSKKMDRHLPVHFAFLSGTRKPPEKLSPLLQQGAPRGSLASAGEGRGEASRCTLCILKVSESHVMS